MSHKAAIQEVNKYYEQAKAKAEKLYRTRRQEIHDRFPRTKEIEDEIASLSHSVMRQMSDNKGDSETLIANYKTAKAALKAEKREIFAKNNVPENYFTDIYECNLCKDTGYLEKATTKDYRCNCRKQRIIEKNYSLSNLNDVLQRENFEHFNLNLFDNQEIQTNGFTDYKFMQFMYKVGTEFVETFDNSFKNLLFHGPAGTGKTFLINCIAKDLLDKGKIVLYFTAPQLFEIISDYHFANSNEKLEENPATTAINADLLIIDDLGAEMVTRLTAAELFNIINQRILHQRSTLVSANYPLEHPNENETTLESLYSDRTISRIYGAYQIYSFLGKDMRSQNKLRKYEKKG
ncbi:MAG: ATP-binding protein [Firmicutes bacterium]|nr:ATP-binding protein [Bacillota bacterium]